MASDKSAADPDTKNPTNFAMVMSAFADTPAMTDAFELPAMLSAAARSR
jgi:hypothetical protein